MTMAELMELSINKNIEKKFEENQSPIMVPLEEIIDMVIDLANEEGYVDAMASLLRDLEIKYDGVRDLFFKLMHLNERSYYELLKLLHVE